MTKDEAYDMLRKEIYVTIRKTRSETKKELSERDWDKTVQEVLNDIKDECR